MKKEKKRAKSRTVIIAGWSSVAPQERDRCVQAFKKLVERARRAPGCLDVSISPDPLDLARINVLEVWESEKALAAWREVANPPKNIGPFLEINVLKHIVAKSGPPF